MIELRKYLFIIIAVLVVALIISILYGVGKGAELEEDKVTYDELQSLIADKEIELRDITKELDDNKEYYDELQEIAAEHEELLETVVDYKAEITSLETDIEEKEKELEKINGEIAKVKDEPIKINPGVYYFGEDLDVGRYKLTNQEGYRGNAYFYGDDSFAETFGEGDLSIEEYTFYGDEGDKLKADIPIELYPVE